MTAKVMNVIPSNAAIAGLHTPLVLPDRFGEQILGLVDPVCFQPQVAEGGKGDGIVRVVLQDLLNIPYGRLDIVRMGAGESAEVSPGD